MDDMTRDDMLPDVPRPKCLPTYLVVDVSSSMTPHQEMLNRTLGRLHATLAGSPRVSEFAHVSVIAFSTVPQLVLEMTDMEYVPTMPEVLCSGTTNYGAVFSLLMDRIEIDVDDLKAQGKAVLRPAVFFLTDGAPTDRDWDSAFRQLVAPERKRRPHVITYGFGEAPQEVLSRVATKAAFLADESSDQETALSEAINSLLNSLVTSSVAGEMRIPVEARGYRSIPTEYMD